MSFHLVNGAQTFNTWHLVSLHQFQTGTSTCWNECEAFLLIECVDQAHWVTSSNHWCCALLCSGNYASHHSFTTVSELRNLKYTHWTIPENAVGFLDDVSESGSCVRSDIKTFKISIQSLSKLKSLSFSIGFHLSGSNTITGEVHFNPFTFGLLNNLMQEFGVFWKKDSCDSQLVTENLLQEWVTHTTTDNHFVSHVQHVHYQFKLISDLWTSQNNQDWFLWILQKASQMLDFLLH